MDDIYDQHEISSVSRTGYQTVVTAEEMMQNNYEEMLKHGWLPSSRTKLFSSTSSYHNGEEIDQHLLKSGTYSVQDLLAKKITTPLPPKAPASLGLSYLGYESNPFQPNESWFSKGIGYLKGIQSEPSKLLNAGFAKQAGSIVADFIPGVGNVKSGIEAIIGKDLITGEKLSTTDRLIAATGIVTGGLGKTALKGIKSGLGFAGVGRKVDKGTGKADFYVTPSEMQYRQLDTGICPRMHLILMN